MLNITGSMKISHDDFKVMATVMKLIVSGGVTLKKANSKQKSLHGASCEIADFFLKKRLILSAIECKKS